jgi:hypothetical protein
MMTLIKREIQDAWVMFGLGGLLVLAVNLPVWYTFCRDYADVPSLGVPGIVRSAFTLAIAPMSFISLGLGMLQSWLDQTRKVSAFLATLAVSREQIFLARVLAGLLLVTGMILILLLGFGLNMTFCRPVMPLNWTYIILGILTAFLLNTASYAVGVMLEQGKNRVAPAAATLALWYLVLWLALMKIDLGQLVLMLLAITAAVLWVARRRFLAAAL